MYIYSIQANLFKTSKKNLIQNQMPLFKTQAPLFQTQVPLFQTQSPYSKLWRKLPVSDIWKLAPKPVLGAPIFADIFGALQLRGMRSNVNLSQRQYCNFNETSSRPIQSIGQCVCGIGRERLLYGLLVNKLFVKMSKLRNFFQEVWTIIIFRYQFGLWVNRLVLSFIASLLCIVGSKQGQGVWLWLLALVTGDR